MSGSGMGLVVALETSSPSYGVAVGTPTELIHELTLRRDEDAFRSIGELVRSALDSAGVTFPDLDYLAVDVGPGNLSSVRNGIAYVNGLAFSLDKRIFCANSLELLALQAAAPDHEAVLCLRNAGGGTAYAGLFQDGAVRGMRRGPVAEVVTGLCDGQPQVSVAGALRSEAYQVLTEAQVSVKDTGIEYPRARTLHQLLTSRPEWTAELVPVASPITEASAVFQ